MSIYQEIILDHCHNPRNYGHLKKSSNTLTVDNPSCGDVITMEVRFEDDVVREVAFSGEGCAISKAASSILTVYMKGKDRKTLIKFSKDDMINLLGIELSPNRLKCGLLAWEGMKKICQTKK